MYGCWIVGVILEEKNDVMICLAFVPGNAFKGTSPFLMKELNPPIRKFFKMLPLKRIIFFRFLIMALLKVDCIISTGLYC